jgi:protein-S-isoprenylcysteine O-methyltransferase Ste14
MATVGIALEGVGYCIVSSQVFRRDQFVPFVAGSQALEWGLGALAVGIAAASVGLTNAAVLRLGKQWALAARLVEGHALIQDGPYGIVRNPIYLAMFGMLLATGLVATQWIWLAVASLLFLAGTYVRVRSEERLLRGAFGGAFDEYARKVPAFIPGVY